MDPGERMDAVQAATEAQVSEQDWRDYGPPADGVFEDDHGEAFWLPPTVDRWVQEERVFVPRSKAGGDGG